MPGRSPELLEAALINLMLTAKPFTGGRGLSGRRDALNQAIDIARQALTIADAEGIKPDWVGLKQAADQADEERKIAPGYRADLEG